VLDVLYFHFFRSACPRATKKGGKEDWWEKEEKGTSRGRLFLMSSQPFRSTPLGGGRQGGDKKKEGPSCGHANHSSPMGAPPRKAVEKRGKGEGKKLLNMAFHYDVARLAYDEKKGVKGKEEGCGEGGEEGGAALTPFQLHNRLFLIREIEKGKGFEKGEGGKTDEGRWGGAVLVLFWLVGFYLEGKRSSGKKGNEVGNRGCFRARAVGRSFGEEERENEKTEERNSGSARCYGLDPGWRPLNRGEETLRRERKGGIGL